MHHRRHGANQPPSPYEQYLNYGLFERPERVGIWDLHLDTWYYELDKVIGQMEPAQGPVTHEGGGHYLWRQLSAFRDAFASLARLDATARVNLQEREPIPTGYWADVPLADEATFLRAVEAAFARPDDVLRGAYVGWDARVVVRDDEGRPVERWLPHTEKTWLRADLEGRRLADVSAGQPVRWRALVYMSFVSLFRRDNGAVLAVARDTWRRLRALNPAETLDRDELSPAELIVALADPPAGTPSNNQDLYERNAPRLREAVARWEYTTGYPFEWRTSLDS
ncbi:MAG TPA: hypothetical protein VIC85_01505 [Ktedonobacterales bacterium]|jgi:hypothetical protein